MILGLALSAFVVGSVVAGCGGGRPTCLAIPTCGAGEQSSQAPCGSAEAGCRTVTLCEQTVSCRPAAGDAGP